ncbi:MAG: endonuclease/exonuclease/phosphatase family protein [Candidatus Omnitrophota bacterium]|nr:endonuclease/exonuclease/phosphatase family protein [Candidatus Omnitrophota bacterium]
MKILTLNTWQERGPWEARWELIIDWIDNEKPDFIAFQELFNGEWAAAVRKRTGYGHLVSYPEPSGLVFLSQQPVVNSALVEMQAQSPTEDYSRYALFSEFEFLGKPLTLLNTHLSWKLGEDDVRARQVDELLSLVDRRHEGRLVFAMGDFNSPPEGAAIRKMVRQGSFKDAYAGLHPGEEGLTWSHRNPYTQIASTIDGAVDLPARRLDYIFVKEGAGREIRAASVEVVLHEPDAAGVWPSDHFGLLATFEGLE